jgi:hypothetical protein
VHGLALYAQLLKSWWVVEEEADALTRPGRAPCTQTRKSTQGFTSSLPPPSWQGASQTAIVKWIYEWDQKIGSSLDSLKMLNMYLK